MTISKSFAICFLIFASALSFELQESRIIGGEEAVRLQFPFICVLKLGKLPDFGSTIISQSWILTVAHAFIVEEPWAINCGKWDRGNVESGEQLRPFGPEQIYIHENFVETDPNEIFKTITYDIALVHLLEPLEFSPSIQPVVLAPLSYVPTYHTIVKAVGWGSTDDRGQEWPDILRFTDLTLISREECEAHPFVLEYNIPVYRSYCARSFPDTICRGDAGGPLLQEIDGVWTQVAIISWGSHPCGGENGVSGHTGIPYYRNWITKTIADVEAGIPLK